MSNRRILLILGIVAVFVLLMLLFRSDRTRISWRETYEADSKDPYGTFVIYDLLKNYFAGKPLHVLTDSISGELPKQTGRKANYVFVGEAMFMDSAGVNTLLKFVESGNTALVSSKTIPFDIMFHLYFEECNDYYWDDYVFYSDTSAMSYLSHPNLQEEDWFSFKFLDRNKAANYNWHYIEDYYFCDEEEGLASLGYLADSLTNFARVNYGQGYFYLHTTPLAFTNIQLLKESGLDYADKVFSHLVDGPIYWDEYSRVSEAIGRQRNNPYFRDPNRSLSTKSPLQYILSQPPLTWAWYLLLALGALYLIFQSRRKQRIIPVYEPNTNTSLEFISTIGRLYFMQNNHKQLALQKMKLFQAYIREHYNLQTKEMDEEFINRLSFKSEVPPEKINKIMLVHSNISNSTFVSENTLIEFHQSIDEFYKTCK